MTRDLSKAYVHCPTQEDYDRYMRFLEENTDWRWVSGENPMVGNDWVGYEHECSIGFNYSFLARNVVYCKKGSIISVDEAIEELKKRFNIDDTPMFKEGQIVLVSDNGEKRFENIYLNTLPGGQMYPYTTVKGGDTNRFKRGDHYSTNSRRYIKPLPKTLDGEVREIEGKKYKLTLVSEGDN